jgi:hypothetical protein
MLDITTEDTLTLTDACKVLPRGRNGARPQLSTLLRWVLEGVRGLDGRLVRLEAVRLGRKWVTSRQALQRFTTALTSGLENPPTSPPPRTARQRRRASEQADRELEKVLN